MGILFKICPTYRFCTVQIFDQSWDPPALLTNLNSLPSGDCMTVSGQSSGNECIFPFIWDGITHTSCTTHDRKPGEEPWCSTKVDGNGNHVQERKIIILKYVKFTCVFDMSISLAGLLGGLQLRMSS